jgi:hypothetical protein
LLSLFPDGELLTRPTRAALARIMHTPDGELLSLRHLAVLAVFSFPFPVSTHTFARIIIRLFPQTLQLLHERTTLTGLVGTAISFAPSARLQSLPPTEN